MRPGSELPDNALAEAIRDGDAAAFKQLFFRYYDALFRFVVLKTGDRDSARDLLQELFARVWQHRQRLDLQKSLKSYLYTIAYNLCVDFQRKRKLEHTYFAQENTGEPAIQPEESGELAALAQRAIERLPEPLQTVFTLSRFDGLTYSEIAATLGISVKTVEARMSKALASLRLALQDFLLLLLALLPCHIFLIELIG